MSALSNVSDAGLEHDAVLRSELNRDRSNGRASDSSGLSRATFDPRFSTAESAPDSSSSNVLAVDFKELDDGTIVELVQHPDDPQRTLFGLWKGGTFRYEEKLEYAGRILVPMPRCSDTLKLIRLPRRPEPYQSNRFLARSIFDFLNRYVVLNQEYLVVLTAFVLSTWISDRLPVAPYISLVGLPQSGKTTLLRTLNLICRRPLLVAGVSTHVIYQVYAQLPPTLLIDEAESFSEDVALRRLLRTGTTRDVNMVRGTEALHAYGPKVISWIEPPNDSALFSRCFQISMLEERKRVADLSDATTAKLADTLQGQLLRFRLENYTKVRIAELPNIERLRPRSRDILTALAAPAGDNPKLCNSLITIFRYREGLQKEPLPPEHNAVLATLFSSIHQDSFSGIVCVQDVTKEVNSRLRQAREPLRLSPREVGAVLSILGFSERQRRNNGWILSLWRADQERIHDLVDRHGTDSFGLCNIRKCPLCQGERHHSGQ